MQKERKTGMDIKENCDDGTPSLINSSLDDVQVISTDIVIYRQQPPEVTSDELKRRAQAMMD